MSSKSISLVLPTERTEEPAVNLRRKSEGMKNMEKKKKSARRVSCRDLGEGDIQDWLFTKKPQKSKWDKCRKWCVLKGLNLFIYCSKLDPHAESRIYLPLFFVSEAHQESKKKTAFKIHNQGTIFVFRSDTDQQKFRWINMLSLAAIEYKQQVQHNTSLASNQSGVSTDSSSVLSSLGYSDEEMDDFDQDPGYNTLRRREKQHKAVAPDRLTHTDNAALQQLITSIDQSQIDILGNDAASQRKSTMRQSLAHYTLIASDVTNKPQRLKLKAKQAQVKALEIQLADIETLLSQPTSSNLTDYLQKYPELTDQSKPSTQSPDQSTRSKRSNRKTLQAQDIHSVELLAISEQTDSQSNDSLLTLSPSNHSLDSHCNSNLSVNSADSRPDSSGSGQVYKGGRKHKQLSTDL